MNFKEIKEIVKLMNDNELTEIEVEREGSKLTLKKGGSQPAQVAAAPQPAPQAAPQAAPAVQVEGPVKSAPSGVEITSPMVGTFYRASSPESPPFVEVGQNVDVGQVVCIVEAMKLMNEIKSDVKGKVVEITANNAEPVEFGQPLFVVEPA
ncbi:MAG: acetyl-CoA carboxylase biotin carboxyl carrier protein [Candidatus Omnitrophota bacterium]